jgi:hypothetical protein
MAEKTTRSTTKNKKKKSAIAKKVTRPLAIAAAKKPRRTSTKKEIPAPVLVSTPVPAVKRRPIFQAGTWISLLLLAILVGLAFYLNSQKKKAGAGEATPTLETAYIFTAADGIVSSIEVKPAVGETVKIARNAKNAWAVLQPVAAEADQGLAEAAATQLSALPISSPIEDGKLPGIFGLDKPAYVITIEFKDGKQRTLEVGDAAVSGNGYYVRVDRKKMMITDPNGIDALLQLEFSPPYLNTPTPTAVPPTVTPIPTAEAVATPTP